VTIKLLYILLPVIINYWVTYSTILWRCGDFSA